MNHHSGNPGDVWKHLPLAELLRIHPPANYWETHAGSAWYPLTPTTPRLHGALRFLSSAPVDFELDHCAYLRALRALPGVYPGSATLALQALGARASYILCDTDPESAASLRAAAAGVDARIMQTDGIATIQNEAREYGREPGDVLVHIDPFDPFERVSADGSTPVELGGRLAASGYRLFYWYGYDSPDQRGWARDEIAKLAPGVELWCGEIELPRPFVFPDGEGGTWGCGIVLANMTSEDVQACERLGRGLERISEADVLDGNEPNRLTFSVR